MVLDLKQKIEHYLGLERKFSWETSDIQKIVPLRLFGMVSQEATRNEAPDPALGSDASARMQILFGDKRRETWKAISNTWIMLDIDKLYIYIMFWTIISW